MNADRLIPALRTVRDLRRWALQRLMAASPTPGLDADLLLGAATGHARAFLLAYGETPVPDEHASRFAGWVERAAAGEPIAYLLGWRGFYDLEFEVTPDVLIPRPETELLLEAALEWSRARPAAQEAALDVVDIGTGSGALAVSFARHWPQARMTAIDASPAALAVARRNAARWPAAQPIRFLQGDLLSPALALGLRFDLVMANLPYIPTDEAAALPVSRWEPMLALDGGPDGLLLVRRLLDMLPDALRPGGLALLEIGAGQGAAALALAGGPQFSRARVLPDYAGHDRIVLLEMAAR